MRRQRMNRDRGTFRNSILTSLVILCGATFALQAQSRAVWVRPFVSANVETRRNPVEARKYIRAEVERLKRAGFDTIFLETLWDGYTIYPSTVVPQRPLSIAYGVAHKDQAGQTETFDRYSSTSTRPKRLGFLSIRGCIFFISGVRIWATHRNRPSSQSIPPGWSSISMAQI